MTNKHEKAHHFITHGFYFKQFFKLKSMGNSHKNTLIPSRF